MTIKNSFLLGVITGLGIGYYLASENKEELIDNVKSAAGKVKDVVSEGLARGKKMVNDLRSEENVS